MAVRGETVFLGLRGPVLGGLAIILELRVQVNKRSRSIGLRRLSGSGRRYAKHALNLQGLGVRDLAFRGGHLLILAAPTMAVDGVAAVFEWEIANRATRGGTVHPATYAPLLRLPGGNRADYTEGIAYLGKENAIAVVVDQPSRQRLEDSGRIRVDVFSLGGP